MMEQSLRVVTRRARIEGLRVLQSCTSTWMFDGAGRRFCRIPRDATVTATFPRAWSPYERLEIDELRSCFVVVFDQARTRIVRTWLHVEPCARCRPGPTAEAP